MAKTARNADDIIRLKVTLRGIRPPIWRRLALPGRMTLGDLHHAIQAAMGWEGDHLHLFDISGRGTAIRLPSTGSPTRSG